MNNSNLGIMLTTGLTALFTESVSRLSNGKHIKKLTPEEDLEQAINRVFSQPKEKVKQDLLDLQFKTKADKKAGRNTALKLVCDNFDAKERKLVKNSATSEKVFKMLKSTANKIQAKAVATTAVITGIAAGAVYMVMSDVPGEKK